MKVDVADKQGKVVGKLSWMIRSGASSRIFQVMHQALLRQLANARLGTRDTKTRGEVRGGGREAVAAEGNRARAAGFDSFAAVDRRRCRLGSASAVVQPGYAAQDASTRGSVGAFGEGSRRAVDRRRWLADVEPKTKAMKSVLAAMPESRSLLIVTDGQGGPIDSPRATYRTFGQSMLAT